MKKYYCKLFHNKYRHVCGEDFVDNTIIYWCDKCYDWHRYKTKNANSEFPNSKYTQGFAPLKKIKKF